MDGHSRSGAGPGEIARQRTAPAIYVVDASCRVVLGWQAPDGAEATAAGRDRTLPKELAAATSELLSALRAGAAAPLVRLLDSGFIVRVAPLAGELGDYAAVLVERFRARNGNGRRPTTRADLLGRIIGETAQTAPPVE